MFQNNGSSLDWNPWWKTLRIFTACTTCVIGWWNTWPRELLLDSFLATENRHLSHVGPRGCKSQGHRWREPTWDGPRSAHQGSSISFLFMRNLALKAPAHLFGLMLTSFVCAYIIRVIIRVKRSWIWISLMRICESLKQEGLSKKLKNSSICTTLFFMEKPLLPWKLTCPLKIDGWKMYSLLKW